MSKVTTIAALLVLGFSGAVRAEGCCSHHGGVAGCDEKSGLLMCEDRTRSHGCTCKAWRERHPAKAPEKKKEKAAPAK